jgi:hypothetical protein
MRGETERERESSATVQKERSKIDRIMIEDEGRRRIHISRRQLLRNN